ncbi:MAG: hypothetical protein U0R44_02975 [Candidatus Micrarchaeia archaeon]
MDLEEELLKDIPKDQLEHLIGERIRSFHGFLTRDVALRLIAKEKGLLRSEEKAWKVGEIPKGEKKVTFDAEVRKIWPVAEYSSGKRSRVVTVGDESGTKPLVLWNEDVSLGRNLRVKDRIIVRGAYEKGGELHLGYSGSLSVSEKAGFTALAALGEGQVAHVRGFVTAIERYDTFVRDGVKVRGFSFVLSDGHDERRCVAVGGADRAGRLRVGDEVIIEGAVVKNGNIELGSDARLLSRRSSEMLLGTIRSVECAGGSAIFDVDGRLVRLDRGNALRLLGVAVADDIALSTVVELKKDSILNTRIAVKIEDKDGEIVVRC